MAKWNFDPVTGQPIGNNGGGNYNRGGNYNNGGNYNRGGGSYNNNYRGNNNGGQPKKHSGCDAGRDKNDNPYVRGWKYDKTHGMRSFLAVPYGKTKEHKSGEGRIWCNWMVKVQPQGDKEFIVSGLYDPQTKKVIIPELGYVMNPKGGKGGYTGPFYERKN